MSLLFAGTEPRDFLIAGPHTVTTTAARHNPANTRCAVGISSTSEISTPLFAGQTTLWASSFIYPDVTAWPTSFDHRFLYFRDGNDNAVAVGADYANSTTAYLTIWTYDGASWTKQATATTSFGTRSLQRIMAKLVLGSSGSVTVYSGDVEMVTWSGNTDQNSAVTSITKVAINHIEEPGDTAYSYISEVMVADYDLSGRQLIMIPPTGNSATNADFTGDYSGVDENNRDDSDSIVSTLAGDKEGYTHGALPAGNGAVEAIIVSARAAKGASGPATIKAHLRTNSTDYNQAMVNSLEQFYIPQQSIFALNPDTAAQFTRAEVDALEFGVESAA